VNALNHVFAQVPGFFASAHGQIDYVPVNSQSSEVPLKDAHGQAFKPLQVLYLPVPEDSEQAYWSSPLHLQHMAEGFRIDHGGCAASPHRCPTQRYGCTGAQSRPCQSHANGTAQTTHTQCVLSDHGNVYQSEEAQDLWRLLRAIATPRQSQWMRSAMASRLWGLSLAQLPAFLHDEAHVDALSESCQRWLSQWQQQGVLPMLYSWMHEQHIAARLLASPLGERRLTNLLHLGELLQEASQHLQGPQALLHYLSDKLQLSSDLP
jgi:exodeoxyribonuclease V beta subunit